MLIKVSDYIVKFLEKKNIKHIFVLTGGAALHLIHSAGVSKKLKFIPTLHEQASAMAADSYSRVTKNIGVAFATSGPGATNLVTGVSGAYFDSVPVLYVTGQVSTHRAKNKTGVRQIGFQETDCVSIFKSITKYVVKIKKPIDIVYELEKAYHISRSGRPGPVLIDIPDNIQREMIDLTIAKKYLPKIKKTHRDFTNTQITNLLKLFKNSKRPILIFGWGIHLSNAEKFAKKLIKKLGFPVVTTWGMAHMIESNEPLNIGTWGTHGTRFSNFAVQNSDLVVSIGSRLDTKATGSPINTFARGAKKVVIDIDKFELNKFKKFGLKIDLKIKSDANEIIKHLLKLEIKVQKKEINIWRNQINKWKNQYPIVTKKNYKEKKINPYVFVRELSKQCKNNEIIFVDTGCAIAWMMQAFKFKKNQSLFHDFNNTEMGWALPAAIAGSIAKKKKRIIAVIGDGSLSMNIQELATLVEHKLPIKIFLINNSGHAMIRQTQDQWLKSKYFASSTEGGLPDINYLKIAKEYGIKGSTCSLNSELKKTISKAINSNSSFFCDLRIDIKHGVIPQVKFGKPNEDLEPLLPRKEFLENMLIKPLK